MQNRKIARLLFLASLAIVAILTGCPPPESIQPSGLRFTGLGVDKTDKKKIYLYFDKALSNKVSYTPSFMAITKGSRKSELIDDGESGGGGDYRIISTFNGRVTVRLIRENLVEGTLYGVKLQDWFISEQGGRDSAASTKYFFYGGNSPEKDEISPLAFKGSSNTKMRLSFKDDVVIGDSSRIKVKVKPVDGTYRDASGTFRADPPHRGIIFTLSTPARDGEEYKATVKPGAVFAGKNPVQLTNTEDLDFGTVTYSDSP